MNREDVEMLHEELERLSDTLREKSEDNDQWAAMLDYCAEWCIQEAKIAREEWRQTE